MTYIELTPEQEDLLEQGLVIHAIEDDGTETIYYIPTTMYKLAPEQGEGVYEALDFPEEIVNGILSALEVEDLDEEMEEDDKETEG